MATPSLTAGDTRLLSVDAEARVLLRLRASLAWRTIQWMMGHARLRLTLVVILSIIFWASLYGLFHEAFAFLDSLHAEVISLLFNAFFASLMVMLIFSNGILTYGTMYASPEAKLLLTLPARAESIFGHKFRESLWFSCWGFVLLGSPMLAAYGVVREAPWTYYALLLPFMIAFVIIPATVGSICCIAMAAWLPRLRFHAVAIALAAGSVAAIWLGWSLIRSVNTEGITASWFEETLSSMAIAEHKLLPSWWLSSGLIEAARKGSDAANAQASLIESLKFLALLVSNGLLLQVAGGWVARSAYRLGYSQIAGEVPARRNRQISRFDDLLTNIGSRRRRPLRLLLVKDLRIFRRDIAQWSQFAIFFGLLGLYFFNLRCFNYTNTYRSMIGFLNLAVVGLILSTFTTRFVFPMISLEGRRFWILGLLPVHRDQIVWSKFLFSFIGGLIPCSLLVWLSDSMLGVSRGLLLVHEICCLMLCLGLSGIAVGLGAKMPDLRESSPSKIASGFGGTLSLVMSSLFIIFTVMVVALPVHVFAALAAMAPPGRSPFSWAAGPWGMTISVSVVVVVGMLATCIPMALGLRAFRQLEP
jgi:ABC-2 type transport system permease protein